MARLVTFFNRRRALIFLISILIPLAVLVGLGLELYRQQVWIVAHTAALNADRAQALAAPSWVRFWFVLCAIFLALAVSLWCRYLVWQDYQRDAELAALRAKFVANVSHELRTPLAGIQMCAETLALGRVRDADRQQKYLDTIAVEAARLARLVGNVLEYSRLERAEPHYRLAPVSLRTIADAAVDSLAAPLTAQSFQVRVDGDAHPIQADADAVKQALINLLDNAMKYSGESREVCIRVGESTIEVADHGIGIPGDQKERIFERFYRAPHSLEHNIGGVGLGLTVVRGIMNRHGGRVEVGDNHPAGSVFRLVFPA